MPTSNRFNLKTESRKHQKHFHSECSLIFGKSDRAVVVRDISPEQRGRIAWRNTTWFAVSDQNIHIPAGTIVDLLEREGNTWLVSAFMDDLVDSVA